MQIGLRPAARGYGRLVVSQSTRYTAKGSTKKAPRLKTFGTVTAASGLGGAIGGPLGHKLGGMPGYQAGSIIGGQLGGAGGRKIARSRGWQTRTKQRMTVRATNKVWGHNTSGFHASAAHHTM